MLHNRVSILKWHLFILSIPLLRVIDPCTFDGIIFNGTTLPIIYINTTCYLDAHHQGHWQLFFVGRDVRGGSPKWHLYFGDIILVKHHVNQQWVHTGWLVPSSAELTTIFPSMTNDSPICIWPKMKTSGAAFFALLRHNVNAHTIGPNTCQLATVTVGRPSRVNSRVDTDVLMEVAYSCNFLAVSDSSTCPDKGTSWCHAGIIEHFEIRGFKMTP